MEKPGELRETVSQLLTRQSWAKFVEGNSVDEKVQRLEYEEPNQ